MTAPPETRRNDILATLYIAAVSVAGAAVVGISLQHAALMGPDPRVLAWAVLAALTMMAGKFSLCLPLRPCRLSISDAFVFLSVLLFGPYLATLTGALDGYASSTRQSGAWQKRLFNTAGMALSVHFAAKLFSSTVPGGGLWGDPGPSVMGLLPPVLLLAAAQYVLNTSLVGIIVVLKEGLSFAAVWRGSIGWAGTGYLVSSLAAALVFLVVRQAGVASLIVILPFPPILYLACQAVLGPPARNKVSQAG